MRRIAIFLRKAAGNKFRAAILNTLRLPAVDSALLCSGFFQADHTFRAGADFDLQAYRGCSPITLTPLGIYSYSWAPQFAQFIADLRAVNPCPCVTVTPKRVRGMRWHAKVFVARQGPDPVVAVIGSSNITRRAFGAFPEFNKECDVVMWDENNVSVNQAVEDALAAADVGTDADTGAIVTLYDDRHWANRGPLRPRLKRLEEEVLQNAVDYEP
jgi:phosphatidylserine/phosphatidylglycerophosphate/cardiolipin synthase-like enzyme